MAAAVIAQSLEDLGRDEVRYEVFVNIMPTPQGPQPMLCIMLTMPSSIIGEWTSTMGMIPNLVPDAAALQDAVLKMLEGLRNNHQMEKDATMGQATAPQNGHGPVSGLIVPGR